jgi:HD superfamily phosphodiesterase
MIVKKVEEIVKEGCRNNHHFGYSVWIHHIQTVVKYSTMMAEHHGADKEIVEISALLHDYATIKDYSLWSEHHKYGAQIADEILTELGYPNGKIEQVKHCILSHRGSRDIPRETIEAQCVADGDAMAHFNAIAVMFYVALVLKQMNIVEANEWVLGKLTRSWNKLSIEGRELIREKYEAAILLLEAFDTD